ncbi:hypothetical protein ANO11243_080110 [Dothideomycetidae sp. 11243]|nr:hypothetical protein ANO11243_080110 [fungal sp. No.11243]
MTRDGQVSVTDTEAWMRQLLQDPKQRLALSALSSNDPASILESPSVVLRDTQTFNTAIPHEGTPVTSQRSSGRCWIFAATNVFRVALMKKYNLDKLELSQSYLFFWDKVEKANYFLQNVLDTAKEPIQGRLVSSLLASPVNDGGQWDMLANLVAKYGLVPHSVYPDSWNAMNSRTMDRLITAKLRKDALRLRGLVKSGADEDTISRHRERMLEDVVRIVTLSLGPPPPRDAKLGWEYYDKAGKLHVLDATPMELAAGLNDSRALRACAGTDVHSLFSLVNDPRNEYGSLLTVNRLGNVWGGKPVTYVNVDMKTLKEGCVAMLKKGFPVFFGSDVGQYADRVKGIMDVDLIDYELGFNVKLGMSKAQRIMTGESAMNHAMVLTAVHLSPSGEPVRWRVENSWGDAVGDRGYFVASDAWMDAFCYQAVVDPMAVNSEVRDILKQEPKVLPLWDPMGALA